MVKENSNTLRLIYKFFYFKIWYFPKNFGQIFGLLNQFTESIDLLSSGRSKFKLLFSFSQFGEILFAKPQFKCFGELSIRYVCLKHFELDIELPWRQKVLNFPLPCEREQLPNKYTHFKVRCVSRVNLFIFPLQNKKRNFFLFSWLPNRGASFLCVTQYMTFE